MQENRKHTLIQERDDWRDGFQNGTYGRPGLLRDYDVHRDSELWRSSRQVEKLCEYALWLESKVKLNGG